MKLVDKDGADLKGAVDLDKIPCTGCRHKSGRFCKRYPPGWSSPQPLPDGRVTSGGWAFPPAEQKCGEFSKGE